MRVVVTWAPRRSDRLVEQLRADGFDVVECPLVAIEPIPGPPLDLGGYDWLILTSARAVELVLERATGRLPPVAVIGPGTAEALRAQGLEPCVIAERSTQEGLLDVLPRPAGRVAFAGAEGARDLIVRALHAEVFSLYRTVEQRPEVFPDADLVVLASGSAARSFAALGRDLPCVSIGPVSSAHARRLGIRVVAEAASHDLDGLAEAVRLAASRLASSRS